MKPSILQVANSFSFLLALATAGCATPALWQSTAAQKWQPASPTRLLLVQTTNQKPDVAVFFDQISTNTGKRASRPAAWCPSQSATNLIIGIKAVKQFTNCLASCQTISLFTDESISSESCVPVSYAVWNSTNQNLTVHLDGYPCGPFSLPTTETQRHTTLRILGLPLAVTADAVIVAGVLILIGASGPHP